MRSSTVYCLLSTVYFLGGSAQEQTPAVSSRGDAVSIEEIERTLRGINVDRTSGREGERKAAQYLESRLNEYGITYVRHEARAYLSWPARATLSIIGATPQPLKAISPSFGASTQPEGMTGWLWWVPEALPDEAPLPGAARGFIVVQQGMISPESAWRAQQAGATALIHVNETDILHEMTATTIWGTPTPASAARLPSIPIVSISRGDGERLREAAAQGNVGIHLTTSVDRGWTTLPLVVAEVPGNSPDFILVATHLDAWYEGMTDTAGTVASILEMARVLKSQQASLRRGVRFAWWPGHSFGRYAGSAWYVDRFWEDLDRHCVAYTNLDGAGRRGSRMDAIAAGGWPGLAEFSREFAERLTGKTPPPAGPQPFRPGRDSDSSFQGIGIPEFSIGVPGPPRGHPDVIADGRIAYWHTAQDTLDKLDPAALRLDTRYRVAQIHELATMSVLPHRIAPIAVSYGRALSELGTAAAGRLDLNAVQTAAAALARAAERLDASPRPTSAAAIESLNALLVRITHRLNSTLYSKAGRFDQDPAATMPLLPLLADAGRLAALSPDSDAFGFVETELLRGRNAVLATLRDATEEITHYLNGSTAPSPAPTRPPLHRSRPDAEAPAAFAPDPG